METSTADSFSGIDSDSDEVIGPLALTPRKPASVKDSKGCDAPQPGIPGFFHADVLGRLWRRLVSSRFTEYTKVADQYGGVPHNQQAVSQAYRFLIQKKKLCYH